MKSDSEILQMVRLFRDSKASFSEEQLWRLCEDLDNEVPGIMKLVRARERHTPEEALRLARHQRRVFVVGDNGAQISHPDRPPGEGDEKS